MQGLKGQGLWEGDMTSHICIIFLHLLNSLTYFRIISWPCVSLCEALLSFFRRDRNLEISFLLTQDSENGQTDLSVYKFRILIGMEMKKDLFLGSLLCILLQAYPVQWTSSAECSSITLSCVYMSLPIIRGLCWWSLHYSFVCWIVQHLWSVGVSWVKESQGAVFSKLYSREVFTVSLQRHQ